MLTRLGIATRLLAGFTVLVVLIASLAAYAVVSTYNVANAVALNQRASSNALKLERIQRHLYETRFNMWVFFGTGDEGRYYQAHKLSTLLIEEARDLVASTTIVPERQKIAQKLVDEVVTYKALLERIKGLTDRKLALDSPEFLAARADGSQISAAIDKLGETLSEGYRSTADSKTAEANDLISAFGKLTITIGVVAVILSFAIAVAISRSITRPLSALVQAVRKLANGDTEGTVPGTDRRDEFGPLAVALDGWRHAIVDARAHEAEEARRIAEREERQRRIDAATQQFDQSIEATLSRVKATVEQLHASADTLSANAEQTQVQSGAVSSATDEATANVGTVASASTQLSCSIHEISRQVHQSTTITRAAEEEANEATTKISGLAAAVEQIGNVVKLINDIAAQTNLLALNATIESARAGEAGKGFAVVAHEVKNLAGQTARATEEIGQQIATVQAETQSAVRAINGIAGTISQINELAAAIATAVEQQGAATQEIARNVEQANEGTREVASNISGVAQAALETGRMAQSVFQSANELLNENAEMEREVREFLSNVRAA